MSKRLLYIIIGAVVAVAAVGAVMALTADHECAVIEYTQEEVLETSVYEDGHVVKLKAQPGHPYAPQKYVVVKATVTNKLNYGVYDPLDGIGMDYGYGLMAPDYTNRTILYLGPGESDTCRMVWAWHAYSPEEPVLKMHVGDGYKVTMIRH